MTYVGKAREALRMPTDYSPGDLDETQWGRIGISYHRDSSAREQAVTDAVAGELMDKFPSDFQWQSASHWAVGWVNELFCRVLKDEAIYPPNSEDDLTEAFIFAVDMSESFDICDYETVIAEAEYEETLNNIEREWPATLTGKSDENTQAVFSWLWDHQIYAGGDDATWYSRDEIQLAGFHLGLWDYDYEPDEFWELMESEHCVEQFKAWCQAVAGQQTLEV